MSDENLNCPLCGSNNLTMSELIKTLDCIVSNKGNFTLSELAEIAELNVTIATELAEQLRKRAEV